MLSLRQRSAISINESFRTGSTLEHDTSRGEFFYPFAILARTYLPLKDNFVIGGNLTIVRKKSARRSTLQNGKRTGGAIMQSRTNDKTFSFVAFAIAFIFILVATLWINP